MSTQGYKYSVAILRVSTKEQDTATQRSLLLEECKRRGLEPVPYDTVKLLNGGNMPYPKVCVIVEDYATGRKQTRKTYSWVIAQVKACRVDSVLVLRGDRIGRSLKASLDFATACRDTKTELFSLKEQIDLVSASGKFLFAVLAAAAEHESDLISERVKEAYDYLKQEADRTGTPLNWGGRKKGQTNKETAKLLPTLKIMVEEGMAVRRMARATGLDHKTVRRWKKKILAGEGWTVTKT